MRKRIWIFCILGFAVCLMLLLFRSRQQKTETTVPPKGPQASANQPPQPEKPKVVQNRQATNISRNVLVLPANATPLVQAIAETNPVAARTIARWQTPIEFYGKVIDQNSNAVSGARIDFDWVEIPAEDGNRTTNTASDAEGLFSLQGERGPDLGIVVSKEGYYPTQGGARYGPFGNPDFTPDPRNPIVFTLQKRGKGEPLIQTAFPPGVQIVQLRHDGTPISLDLLRGSQVTAGNGQLTLQFWRDISEKNAQTFDWKLQFSVAGGGLVQTDEKFPFQAPEGGYQPIVVIDMPKTNQPWLGEVRTKYYVQLPSGNYGRFDFYLLPYNGVFTVQSAINPSSSRNLEPAN